MKVYGITDTRRLEERVPTCAFTFEGKPPRQVAEELDETNTYMWDGNYYALEVTRRLGLEESGSMVRVRPVLGSLLPDRMMAIVMQYIGRRLHYGASGGVADNQARMEGM